MRLNAIPLCISFDYINWRGEAHKYIVLPIDMQWTQCKCFPTEPDRESWAIRAMCLKRDGESRVAIRTFALVKMRNIEEVPIEAG